MKEISVYKNTTDDWCGSYKIHKWPIQLVEITYYHHKGQEDEFLIVATGTDDYSLMKRNRDEKAALTDFMTIIGTNDVTIDLLKSMQFELNC